MSTRANIIVKDQYSKLYFYRHSDGYPEGAIPTLEKFLNLVKEKKIRNNVGQAAGWLILLGADEYDTHGYSMEEMKADLSGKPKNSKLADMLEPANDGFGWKVGAIEPTDQIHGDIEYLYTIDLDKETISVKHV